MRKCHVYYWGSLALLMVLAGCKPPGPVPTTQPVATMSAKSTGPQTGDKAKSQWDLPDTDKPVITDIKGADAEALAKATQDYAHAMELLMAKHGGLHPGTIPADPSKVHFDDAAHTHSPDAATPGAANPAAANIPGTDPHAGVPEQIASRPPPVSIPGPSVTQTPPAPDLAFNKDSPAVNMPLVAAQPRPLPATDDMAQKMLKQVRDYPQDLSSQLDWQLLQMLQGQSVPQLRNPVGIARPRTARCCRRCSDGLTHFRNALKADNNMLLSRKIRPMLELSDRLRTQAELSIPTVALCTDVKGFGVYERWSLPVSPPTRKSIALIVYCEVENFASQLDDQKRWETKLTQELVLYTEQNGLEVWRDKTAPGPIIDYSRNRRHDFFYPGRCCVFPPT